MFENKAQENKALEMWPFSCYRKRNVLNKDICNMLFPDALSIYTGRD
jgi:hypothetical protein